MPKGRNPCLNCTNISLHPQTPSITQQRTKVATAQALGLSNFSLSEELTEDNIDDNEAILKHKTKIKKVKVVVAMQCKDHNNETRCFRSSIVSSVDSIVRLCLNLF